MCATDFAQIAQVSCWHVCWWCFLRYLLTIGDVWWLLCFVTLRSMPFVVDVRERCFRRKLLLNQNIGGYVECKFWVGKSPLNHGWCPISDCFCVRLSLSLCVYVCVCLWPCACTKVRLHVALDVTSTTSLRVCAISEAVMCEILIVTDLNVALWWRTLF